MQTSVELEIAALDALVAELAGVIQAGGLVDNHGLRMAVLDVSAEFNVDPTQLWDNLEKNHPDVVKRWGA